PVNAAVSQPHVTRPRPVKNVVTNSHSPPRRTINSRPYPKPSTFPQKVTTAKAPHCNPQHALQDKGVIDSGCARHMTGNMSYLSDFESINEGYVAFGRNLKGDKFKGKCNIKTGQLKFDDVYFVKELKFNLFSVSQMCDKKNSVLFTDTECIVLSFDFKLPDESHVLLRVLYNVDLKNIIPSGDLTCLFAKGTLDESNLWHRRLGHINFKTMNKLVKGSGPKWLFDIDTLTQSMNYQPLIAGNQPNHSADADAAFDVKENENEVHVSLSSSEKIKKHDDKAKREAKGKSLVDLSTGAKNLSDEFEDFSSNSTNRVTAATAPVTAVGPNLTNSTNNFNAASPFDTAVSPTFNIGGKSSFVDPSQYPDDLDMPALEDIVYSDDEEDVGAEADFSDLETSIILLRQAVWQGWEKNKEEGIDYKDVFAPVARIEAIRLFLAYASFMGFMVYQMDVKSTFLYGTIEEEVYVCQTLGFEDPDYPNKFYKVVKALYGLHQAPSAWYETLANYLLENGFQRRKIYQTLFIKKQKGDIFLVQVYVDDIIFRSTNKELCKAFEKLMKDKFQMNGKSASTPIDIEKPLLKDHDGEDMDVHIYRPKLVLLVLIEAQHHIFNESPRLGVNTPRCDEDRGIIELDADEDVTLVDVDTTVEIDADTQGRMEEDVTAVKEISATKPEPTVFDDEKMAKILHDEEVEQATAKERKEQDDFKRAQELQQQYDQKQENMDWNVVAEQIDEEPAKKRGTEETLLQESFKKLRPEVEVSGSHTTQEDTPTVDPAKIYKKDVQNMLVGGVTQAYQSFKDMLKDFNREDMDAVWRITKEKFSTSLLILDKEKALWAELTRLYEPNADDVFWKLQRYMHYPIMWKRRSNYSVHQVSSTTRRYDIYNLAEKDYPLSNQVMT
nr:putative ribonuclease H-like domain-containing protein [Tanacetum cinerariifolium]